MAKMRGQQPRTGPHPRSTFPRASTCGRLLGTASFQVNAEGGTVPERPVHAHAETPKSPEFTTNGDLCQAALCVASSGYTSVDSVCAAPEAPDQEA